MPKFGRKSKEILSTCDERLQEILNEVIKYYDFSVLSGYRNANEQNEIFRKGYSKKQYPDSKHNSSPSIAVDVAPYPINWKDTRRFDILAGYIMMCAESREINLRWGGDWDMDKDVLDQTFNDIGHMELL